MLDLPPAQRKLAGVEEMDAQLDKRDKQEQVERRHRMRADLRCDLIEAEGPGEHDHEGGRNPNGRIDPDDDP